MQLILMLCLNEKIDKLANANSVCCYGSVLQTEDGHVLGRSLEFDVEKQRNGDQKGYGNSLWRKSA